MHSCATHYSECSPTSDALNIITVGKTAKKKHNKSKIITIIVELRQERFGTWNRMEDC